MQTSESLLPSGFVDLLPPFAWHERYLRYQLLERFRRFGYEEVSPPLLEFEDSLRSPSGLDTQTFRVMDAASQRMMAIRADMTPQIARIAASRMNDLPHPLRLSYAGTCLRVKGEGLYKSRQLVQAGIECIGATDDTQLIEVLRATVEALESLKMNDLTIDVSLPSLQNSLLSNLSGDDLQRANSAIAQKDRHTISQISTIDSALILKLMDGITVEAFKQLLPKLPKSAQAWLKTVEKIATQLPALPLTLDPLEENGFDYYEGIAFSLFSKHINSEIGRGGGYRAHENLLAYGLTLYLNPLLYNSIGGEKSQRCLVLKHADESIAADLRQKGWLTSYSSASKAEDATDEAKQLACSHLLEKDELIHV